MSESEDSAARFADALVREVRVEMARHDVRSVRALAELMGVSHGAINDRMNVSSRTGKRVDIGMEDLWRIAAALHVDPSELVRRARLAANEAAGGAAGDVTG